MDNLRLLSVDTVSTAFQGESKYLPRKLKWLKWKGGSDSEFLTSGFRFGNIVVLDLSHSRLTRLWSQPPSGMKELKVLDLSGCKDLLATPSFSWVPSLKKLILDDCTKLVEVHGSIGQLRNNLGYLSMRYCCSVKQLPDSITELISLEYLDLRDCHKLSALPNRLGDLSSLESLNVSESGIAFLPDMSKLKNLLSLDLSGCKGIGDLPEWIGCLRNLEALLLCRCRRLESLPNSIGHLKNLRELRLDGTMMGVLPDSVASLEKLVILTLNQCRNLKYFPVSVTWTNLERLEIGNSSIKELSQNMLGSLTSLKMLHLERNRDLHSLPSSLESLSRLLEFRVMDSDHLESVAGIPSSVTAVQVIRCRSLVNINSISNCTALENLELDGCWSLQEIPALKISNRLRWLSLNNCRKLRSLVNINTISNCTALQYLSLNGWCSLQEIPALKNSNRLERLSLDYCRRLRCLPQLPPSLRYLSVRYCISLVGNSNLSNINLECLEELRLGGCGMLAVVPGLPKALKRLTFVGCAMEILEGVESLEFLEILSVKRCRRLSRIDRLPPSLQQLRALRCPALKTVDVSNSKSLSHLNVSGCTKLVDIGGIEKLNGIQFLRLGGCKNLSGGLTYRIAKVRLSEVLLVDVSVGAEDHTDLTWIPQPTILYKARNLSFMNLFDTYVTRF